jgi:hypothetical protein
LKKLFQSRFEAEDWDGEVVAWVVAEAEGSGAVGEVVEA